MPSNCSENLFGAVCAIFLGFQPLQFFSLGPWFSRAANGWVSNGGVSRSGLVLPFLSFFVLFGTFPIFPGFSRFVRGLSGDFPIRPVPLSRPIKSAYEEQSRKGPRHNLDLSRKPPGLETPRFSFPQDFLRSTAAKEAEVVGGGGEPCKMEQICC